MLGQARSGGGGANGPAAALERGHGGHAQPALGRELRPEDRRYPRFRDPRLADSPGRARERVNASFNQRQSPFYPRDLRLGVRRSIDLNLRLADELLRRPGGTEGQVGEPELRDAVPCSINWPSASSTRTPNRPGAALAGDRPDRPMRIGASCSSKRTPGFSISAIRRLRSSIKATSGCP